MNVLIMLFALLGALLAEMAFPAVAWLGQAKPPLVASLVLYYALHRSQALMLTAAVLGGILSESLAALPLGYLSVCLLAAGLLARAYREVVFSRRWITHMVFGVWTGVGVTLALYVLLWISDNGAREISLARVIAKITGVGLYALLVAPLLLRGMAWLERVVGNLEIKEQHECAS